MNLVAHVAGVPVEEALLSLSSVGGALLVARGWLALHWRRRAKADTHRAMGREQPLIDLRVIAVEQFGAGPWATMQLADLGADVIKVEDPSSGGDVGRYVPPLPAR